MREWRVHRSTLFFDCCDCTCSNLHFCILLCIKRNFCTQNTICLVQKYAVWDRPKVFGAPVLSIYQFFYLLLQTPNIVVPLFGHYVWIASKPGSFPEVLVSKCTRESSEQQWAIQTCGKTTKVFADCGDDSRWENSPHNRGSKRWLLPCYYFAYISLVTLDSEAHELLITSVSNAEG